MERVIDIKHLKKSFGKNEILKDPENAVDNLNKIIEQLQSQIKK
jgi:hypothetical protein